MAQAVAQASKLAVDQAPEGAALDIAADHLLAAMTLVDPLGHSDLMHFLKMALFELMTIRRARPKKRRLSLPLR